jgi:lathosterol oxidase
MEFILKNILTLLQDSMYNLSLIILWNLCLYSLHRITHITPVIKDLHRKHHIYVLTNPTGWHWNNVFLYNDNLEGTLDFWVTEVIPTIIFCAIFNCWWLFMFFWIWAAFFQENLEHNNNINFPFFTFGKWHVEHHKNPKKNFGFFFPIWDKLFRTEKCVL